MQNTQMQMGMGSSQSGMYSNTQPSNQYPSTYQRLYPNGSAMQQSSVRQSGTPYGSGMSQRSSSGSALESSPALAMMGLPNSIHSTTTEHGTEYYQTKMIEVELERNAWGFGINLGDANGIVRIQGCRHNPDGTPSPVEKSNIVHPGDVIYKIQNTVITGKEPLGLVSVWERCEVGCGHDEGVQHGEADPPATRADQQGGSFGAVGPVAAPGDAGVLGDAVRAGVSLRRM